MAEHGAKVVVSSRKAGPCEEVVKAIEAKHGKGRAISIPANISSKDDLKHLVDETNKQFGRIDALVCNAASNPYYGPLMGISDEQFRKILDNNVIANNWLIQFASPRMIERKDGSIIIVSSVGGLKGNAIIGAYNISKAADFQLARNLAAEFGPHNVRINCIAPGLIKTDFARALWEDPDNLKRSTSRTPLGRIGDARRDCRRGGVSGVRRGDLHDRAVDHHRRRRDDYVIAMTYQLLRTHKRSAMRSGVQGRMRLLWVPMPLSRLREGG